MSHTAGQRISTPPLLGHMPYHMVMARREVLVQLDDELHRTPRGDRRHRGNKQVGTASPRRTPRSSMLQTWLPPMPNSSLRTVVNPKIQHLVEAAKRLAAETAPPVVARNENLLGRSGRTKRPATRRRVDEGRRGVCADSRGVRSPSHARNGGIRSEVEVGTDEGLPQPSVISCDNLNHPCRLPSSSPNPVGQLDTIKRSPARPSPPLRPSTSPTDASTTPRQSEDRAVMPATLQAPGDFAGRLRRAEIASR